MRDRDVCLHRPAVAGGPCSTALLASPRRLFELRIDTDVAQKSSHAPRELSREHPPDRRSVLAAAQQSSAVILGLL